MLSGDQTGSDYSISIDAANTEKLQSSTNLTIDGENSAVTDNIIDLDQFNGTLGTDDLIVINGTDNSGAAITPFQMTVNENTTIEHIIDNINTAFEGIATASFDDGQIIFTDDTSGESSISIDLSFQQGDLSTASMTLPSFQVTAQGGTVTADIDLLSADTFVRTQAAQDSQIKVDGYPLDADEWIERSSNTINDVITGVTFSLLDLPDPGETLDVSITRDSDEVQAKVEEMVTAYNQLMDAIDEKTLFNDSTQEMGILNGNAALSFIKSRLRDPFIGTVTGYSTANDTYASASDIGLGLDGNGRIDFDSEIFSDALDDNYLALIKFLGAIGDGVSDNSSVGFYDATQYTEAGQYDVRVATDSFGNPTGAWIKLQSEDWADARQATVSGNNITASMDFSGSDPEKGLQLIFQWQNDGAHTYNPAQPDAGNPVEATISVRHGMGKRP